MSGTFMDGGSFDGSNAGSDCFVDGGDHDHGHDHGHHGIDSYSDSGNDSNFQHGHERGGFSLGALLGLNQQQHHSFLAHLLGLDHDAHDHGGDHGDHGEHGEHNDLGSSHVSHEGTSGIGIWAPALQSITLSTFLQGFKMTPAVWMLTLFMSYIGWLCVVYWIRHHEPFANSVLGTTTARSSTSNYDRRMIAGIKEALPLKTSSKTGDFYVPIPGSEQGSAGSAQATVPATAPIAPPATLMPIAPPSTTIVPSAPEFGPAPMMQPAFSTGASPAFNVPVYNMNGHRLKTIVDR